MAEAFGVAGQPRNPLLALLLNLLRARSIIAAIRCCEDHALPFPTRGRAGRGLFLFCDPLRLPREIDPRMKLNTG